MNAVDKASEECLTLLNEFAMAMAVLSKGLLEGVSVQPIEQIQETLRLAKRQFADFYRAFGSIELYDDWTVAAHWPVTNGELFRGIVKGAEIFDDPVGIGIYSPKKDDAILAEFDLTITALIGHQPFQFVLAPCRLMKGKEGPEQVTLPIGFGPVTTEDLDFEPGVRLENEDELERLRELAYEAVRKCKCALAEDYPAPFLELNDSPDEGGRA